MNRAFIILLLSLITFPAGKTTVWFGTGNTDFILVQLGAHLPIVCPGFVGCVNGEPSQSFDLCCNTCQCKSTCAQHHSCCPNSPYIQNMSIPYVSQQPGVVCRNTQYSGEPKNVYFSPEYEFVQTCFDTTNETTKFYCENIEGKNKSGLVTDHIPVYDPETGVQYGNIHCAKCNMDDTSNVVPWQPKLLCKGVANLDMSVGGLDQILKENDCELDFVPPLSNPDVRPCFVDVITECNVTGDWIEWDEIDAYFCENIDLLYVPIEREMRKYKNIFCARCNGEVYIQAATGKECPNRPPFDTSEEFTTIISYSVQDLDPDQTENMNNLEAESRCPRNYRFDPIMTDCMPLFCSPPLYFDVTTSTCMLFHQSVANMRGCYPFYLTFDTALTLLEAQTVVEELHTEIYYIGVSFMCSINVFYQTYSVADKNHHWENITTDIVIKGIYFLVYTSIWEENPSEIYKKASSIMFDYLSTNYTRINMTVQGSDGFDPNMLRHEKTNDLVSLTYEAFTFSQNGAPSHYVFVNMYDDTIILGHIENSLAYCGASIYKEDFIACPTFMYEFTSSFTRAPDGVTVNYSGEDIHFSFDELKSVNASAVRICSQAVIDKIPVYRSASSIVEPLLIVVVLVTMDMLMIVR